MQPKDEMRVKFDAWLRKLQLHGRTIFHLPPARPWIRPFPSQTGPFLCRTVLFLAVTSRQFRLQKLPWCPAHRFRINSKFKINFLSPWNEIAFRVTDSFLKIMLVVSYLIFITPQLFWQLLLESSNPWYHIAVFYHLQTSVVSAWSEMIQTHQLFYRYWQLQLKLYYDLVLIMSYEGGKYSWTRSQINIDTWQ